MSPVTFVPRSTVTPAPLSRSALTATVAAGQIIAVQRILATENTRLIAAGRAAAEILPEAVAAADRAYG